MELKQTLWYWHELIDVARQYKTIYVTGPQRSGTRYTTFSLAKDLDKSDAGTRKRTHTLYSGKFKGTLYRDEIVSGVRNRYKVVIHCPHETHRLHTLSSNCLVIWMDRNVEDVINSEDKINWHEKCFVNEEIPKYVDMFPEYEDTIKKFNRNWYMKMWVWNNIQKDLMKVDYLELPYETLMQTDGYVSKEDRIGFKKDQIGPINNNPLISKIGMK